METVNQATKESIKTMPRHFEKKVSIIVPVYNVEKYLAECLDSLVNQTMPQDQMEILLINDGSKDNSLQIAQEYAKKHSNIIVFDKENEGLSATRNFGIKHSNGKYLMYIDSDDKFSLETVKSVTDFFDTVYDQVDLVTYLDQPYFNYGKGKLHYRYKVLTKSGIYDLNKYPFITQTRVNICTKNLFENNVLFDTTPHFRHEDLKYNNQILSKKLKIGFCEKGEYMYNRANETSIMATTFNCIELFETTTKYYEDMFVEYKNEVPKYLQAMFLHDISWKLKSNILLPYHYEKEQFDIAISRLKNLISRVEIDVITSYSNDIFHKAFWIKFKENSEVAVVGHDLVVGEKVIYQKSAIELVFYKLRISDNKITMLLSAKSPVFNFVDKPKIYAVIDGVKTNELQLFPSSYNYYHCKTKTNEFHSFFFEHKLTDKTQKIQFIVNIDGSDYPTTYYFMSTAPFNISNGINTFVGNNCSVNFENNAFIINKIDQIKQLQIKQQNNEKYKADEYYYNLRNKALNYKKQNEIWLYYDCCGVEKDNGYYQFINDVEIKDGIDRYYISANDSKTWSSIFKNKHIKKVVKFGSELHYNLFLNADKIITAYIENKNIYPFDEWTRPFFSDMINYEVVYLQHGILHATLPWKYAPEGMIADKIVVSSSFEQKNFTEHYGFRQKDIIPTGMPRYDFMDKNVKSQRRILFAPSWRNYLIGECIDRIWTPMENKFVASNYFKNMQEFLSSKELNNFLTENDLYLDFKPHPIFRCYDNLYTFDSDRITLASNTIKNEEYALFITDFSSFVFDFVYLKKPIIYFVTDMTEFKAGLNQYRELDLPFDKAFGDLALNANDAVNAIKTIVSNNLKIDKKYMSRFEQFFLPLENCRERTYEYIKGEN